MAEGRRYSFDDAKARRARELEDELSEQRQVNRGDARQQIADIQRVGTEARNGLDHSAAGRTNGIHWGPIKVGSGSIWIPTLVISYVLVPYVGRPLRGQVLSLRQKEFIEASISQGAGPLRIMFVELLPNVASSILVFFTLIIANNIVLEAALSFLGAGVQPPTPSWGTLISDGQGLIVTRPWFAIMPGLAIVLTVLALNVFGDGLRDALDPRAKVKIEH